MNNDIDLAGEYFVAKWPEWLRWTLFLPAALIGSLIANFSVAILNWISIVLYTGGESGGIWIDIISSGVFGASFVYLGSWMAPKNQFGVGIALLILISMLGGASLLGSSLPTSSVGLGLGLVSTIAMLIGAGVALYEIKEKLS